MRILFDEDFNAHIIRGLVRRRSDLDFKTARELGLGGQDDIGVLRAAVADDRLVVSHDVNTMSAAFARLLANGERSAGLLLVPQSMPIGQAIEDLEVVCIATRTGDWVDVMSFLPL